MNNKQMGILFGNKKQTDRWIFKVLVNGSQYYIDKHDKKMKKLYDTGKIKQFLPTSEIYRLKKEAEKLKKTQAYVRGRPQDIQ